MADYGVNINLRVKGQSGLDRLNNKVKELTSKLSQEELINWIAFYEVKKELEDKAIQNAKDKSRARKH